MVRIHPDPPDFEGPTGEQRRAKEEEGRAGKRGAIAQLGERLLCKQEVIGSIPIGSTSNATAKNAEASAEGFSRLLLASSQV